MGGGQDQMREMMANMEKEHMKKDVEQAYKDGKISASEKSRLITDIEHCGNDPAQLRKAGEVVNDIKNGRVSGADGVDSMNHISGNMPPPTNFGNFNVSMPNFKLW